MMILALISLTTVFGTNIRTENQAALQTDTEWSLQKVDV